MDKSATIGIVILLFVIVFVIADMKKTRRRKYKSRKWVNYSQKPERARGHNAEQQGVLEKQLEALRATTIKTKRPVNKSAFQIWLALERAIKIHAPRSRVMPEVGMGAFLNTSSDGQISWDDKEAFRAFVAKRVDFLVVDDFGNPAFAVEYHGSGHYIGDTAASRDVVNPNVPDARTPRRIVQTGCSSTNLKKIAPQAWRITFIAFSRAAFAKTS